MKTPQDNFISFHLFVDMFQCFEQHKQNSIHLHCLGETAGVSEGNISKPYHIKLLTCSDTIRGKSESVFPCVCFGCINPLNLIEL